MVQVAGRHIRNTEDEGEVFIMDNHWVWFWHRFGGEVCTRSGCKVEHQSFSPRWFQDRVMGTFSEIPEVAS